MQCPKCGKELEEGKLLCEFCGEEINIVPDFDIELENQLRESLSSMMDDITQEDADHGQETKVFYSSSDKKVDEQNTYHEQNEVIKNKTNQKSKVIRKMANIIVAMLLIGGVIGFFLNNYIQKKIEAANENSFDYQYNMALEYAINSDYYNAIEYMQKAIALDTNNCDAKFLLAKYLEKNNEELEAESILNEILKKYSDFAKIDEVYDMLLNIKKNRAEYSVMNDIIKECKVSRIVSKYNKYAALEPKFNKKGSEYDEVISVTLAGNTQGTVYYTLDGRTPTKNSLVYETPILLESGKYTLSAMFINEYGVCSDVVTEKYTINTTLPKVPVINVNSGVYNEPKLIEIYHDENTKIYYTIDGSVPNKTSIRYTSPIEMPYGISNYSFVAINESGLLSEVVNRNYRLEIEANFSTDVAIQVLVNNLWAQGKLTDIEGHVANKLGRNQYRVETLTMVEGIPYYIVYEEYVDTTGNMHDTSNIFAINSQNGDLYKAYKLDEGKYNLKQFDA